MIGLKKTNLHVQAKKQEINFTSVIFINLGARQKTQTGIIIDSSATGALLLTRG